MLMTLSALLTPDEVAHCQALLTHPEREADWRDGRLSAGTQAAQVKHNQQLSPQCATAQVLQGLVLAALARHQGFFSAALPKRVWPPMFNRHAGRLNHYGDHVDQAIRYLPAAAAGTPGGAAPAPAERLRSDLSCTVFLSEPSSYEGGELVVQLPDGPRPVKLPAGHAVLYSATTVHQVAPVTRGTRLASFFWIESLVRRDDQRQLLLTMDRALVQLRSRDGESDEAVALTGTYHNLLRMWADT